MRRKRRVILFGILVVMLVSGGFWVYRQLLATRCHAHVCMIADAISLYCMDHGDNLPARMSELNGYANPSIFVCPSTGSKPGQMTNVDDWMDYVYLPWGSRTNTPPDYPMLYDRRIRHPGRMINIVYVDCGTVEGDKNAKELKQFAAEHPDINVPMPEGLK